MLRLVNQFPSKKIFKKNPSNDEFEQLELIMRARAISSNSTLGKTNADIKKFNASSDALTRYYLLNEIYFQVKLKLIQSDIKPDSKDALQMWLKKQDIAYKVALYAYRSLSHYPDQLGNVKAEKLEKNFTKSLKKINERLSSLRNLDPLFFQFEKLTEVLISDPDAYSYIFCNKVLNLLFQIRDRILSVLSNDQLDLRKDDIRGLLDLTAMCNGLLELAFHYIKTKEENFTLYNQIISSRKTLSTSLVQSFHQFDSKIFDAFMDCNISGLAENKLDAIYLGGGSNQVYKLHLNNKNFAVKIYRQHQMSEYEADYMNLLQVRTRFGEACSRIIGGIYFEKEFFQSPKDANAPIVVGRIEISEFCTDGNLESKYKKYQKLTDLMSKDRDFRENLLNQFINHALQMVNLICLLNQLKVAFPDIKTSNFFVNENGEIIIPDFKTMFICDDFTSVPFTFNYSQYYLPPEIKDLFDKRKQDNCNMYDLQSYALGLTFYEMLTADFEYKYNKNTTKPDFNHILFQDEKGQQVSSLLQSLMSEDARDRLSLDALKAALEDLNKTNTYGNAHKSNSSSAFFVTDPVNSSSVNDVIRPTVHASIIPQTKY